MYLLPYFRIRVERTVRGIIYTHPPVGCCTLYVSVVYRIIFPLTFLWCLRMFFTKVTSDMYRAFCWRVIMKSQNGISTSAS